MKSVPLLQDMRKGSKTKIPLNDQSVRTIKAIHHNNQLFTLSKPPIKFPEITILDAMPIGIFLLNAA